MGARGAILGVTQQDYDRRLAMADAYRGNQIKQFETTRDEIQKALASDVNPYSQKPWAPEEKQAAQASLAHINSMIQNLYNPNFDPAKGSVGESILHKLTDKMKITKPPDVSGQKQTTAAAQGDLQKYTMPPGADVMQKQRLDQAAHKQKLDEAEKTLRSLGLNDDEIKQFRMRAEEAAAGVRMPTTQRFYKAPDGKQADWFIPGEQPEGWQASSPTAMNKPGKQAWTKKDGKFVSVLLDPFTNQPIPGTENDKVQPPASVAGRVSTGFYYFVGDDGDVHQIPTTRYSGPAGGGKGEPSPPSSAKPSSATSSPTPKGGKTGDRVIGHKLSLDDQQEVRGFHKDYTETKIGYRASIDRQKTMHKNLEAALGGDQQAMLSLTANHIGMTLGAQKGARINQAVWNEAVESAPWLAQVAAKFDERGYLSGVVLTPEQMQQMVRLADEKVDVLKEHLDDLEKEREKLPGRKKADTGKKESGGTAVKLSDARKLERNKGKSDDEIVKDIEAHGHKAIRD